MTETGKTEQDVRAKLAQLQARYDSDAVPPSIFSAIRSLQVELAWMEHWGRKETSDGPTHAI